MSIMFRNLEWLVLLGWIGIAAWGVAEEPSKKEAPLPVIKVVEVEKIAAALETEVIIRGQVTRTGKSKTGINFLNFANYNFVVVCFPSDAKSFEDGEPADLYKAQVIEVRGKIEKYRDKFQIKLRNLDQIKIVDRSEAEQDAKPDSAKVVPKKEPKAENESSSKDSSRARKPVDAKRFFDC